MQKWLEKVVSDGDLTESWRRCRWQLLLHARQASLKVFWSPTVGRHIGACQSPEGAAAVLCLGPMRW
jgi:hypothetical protein